MGDAVDAPRVERFLAVGLVVLMIVTIATILFSIRRTTATAAVALIEDVVERVVLEATDEAGVFLGPAERTARLSASLLADDLFSEAEPDRLERYLLDQLAESPLVDGLYIGRPDGDFFFVKRAEERGPGATRTKIIDSGPGIQRTVTLRWRDGAGTMTQETTDPDDTYDPRTRPWYTNATASPEVVWTDPYVFFTSQRPGITAAKAIVDPVTGAPSGVFGIDVEVSILSTILARIEVSEEGGAYIVDRTGQVVATSLGTDIAIEDGGDVRLASPYDLADDTVAAVATAMFDSGGPNLDGDRFLQVPIDGRSWRVGLRPFGAGQWPWTIAVFAPEDDFLTGLREAADAHTWFALAVGIVATLLTLGLTAGIRRPMSRLRRHAFVDPLTGLANRRALEDRARAFITRRRSAAEPFAVGMLDIDHFKRINDAYGHAIGDEVLRAVASRLARSVKDGDIVARYGGEEFTVLIADADHDAAAEIGERLRHAIGDAPINTSAGPIPATTSVGLTVQRVGDDADLDELMTTADAALYEAKVTGRNRSVVAVGSTGRREAPSNP